MKVINRASTSKPMDLDDLPPVLDLAVAAEILGIGRSLAYGLVSRGRWPTPIIRIGRLIKVPSAPLRALVRDGTVLAYDNVEDSRT
jgi:predicted DNA-binding transcriptional regulator AlpA